MELLEARHASERDNEQRTAEQNLNCIVDQVQEQSRKQEKELAEQLSAKDTEIAELNAKLKQQSVQWQAVYERNNGLEKANADLLAEVTELRRQNEDQSQKLASMATDAEEAQDTLKQMSDQLFARNDELGEKVSSLEAKCASLESDLSETQAEKDTLKEKAEKLELEVETLKQKLEKMDEELVAERLQVKSATDKERDFHEKTLARDELVAENKRLKEKLRERDSRIRQMEKELKDKKQREDVTRKNAHAAATAAGSQASTEQKSIAPKASARSKQNASQSMSQSASAPEFKAPAAKPTENPAKRPAMHPIPIAQSTPVANRLHAAAASPREPKRTKDSVKASAAASLKANALALTVTPRACTSLHTGTYDNKEYVVTFMR
ncbi:hypothetical protein AAVH_17931 [Aphelenchoides avenae]|nr:hypothetical protein AAVH_17931 [Aphelenchus avenae]